MLKKPGEGKLTYDPNDFFQTAKNNHKVWTIVVIVPPSYKDTSIKIMLIIFRYMYNINVSIMLENVTQWNLTLWH